MEQLKVLMQQVQQDGQVLQHLRGEFFRRFLCQ
jgi:hypothetical protein